MLTFVNSSHASWPETTTAVQQLRAVLKKEKKKAETLPELSFGFLSMRKKQTNPTVPGLCFPSHPYTVNKSGEIAPEQTVIDNTI